MHKNSSLESFVFLNRTGCLLPLLIILNLLFGWVFLRPMHWLLIEAILILILIVTSYFVAKKIFSSPAARRDDVIDVKGEVVEDRQQLK